MPKFVETPKKDHEAQVETIATWEGKFSVYQSLSEECKRDLPFRDLCETQFRENPRGAARNSYQNYELNNSIGKTTLPYFDGTSNCSVSSWIQKMDTKFQLNPIVERDAIKFASLHLDVKAIAWWFHGMKALGHYQVVTYEEFTRKLIERFDWRDLDISFRDLAHIRQVGTLEAYISEFQKVAVMVTDISESRLILLFTEGLIEPLKKFVKDY